MSALARKQMEKMGWKDGEGLGRDGSGIKTFVRVQKRANAGEAIGIGHEASEGTRNSDMGMDAVLQEIAAKKKRTKNGGEEVQASSSSSSSSSSSDSDANEKKKKRDEKPNRASSSSSSSSSSDEDGGGDGFGTSKNVVAISDEELFRRCNGVRLGRGGRHRFFDGKLSRVQVANAQPVADPVSIAAASSSQSVGGGGSDGDASAAKRTKAYRKRLQRFFSHYCPERVEKIDRLLEKNAGVEEQMMELLVEKYGPEV